MYKFSELLKTRIKQYFLIHYGLTLTDEEANQFLDALASFFDSSITEYDTITHSN